ncbi:MAG: ribonucleoside-diphosphate reductase subunit alpha [Patescibacteria group bacterium]|jgi:ribonucleoside-diphosphate reductase alpha chain|nr:ribonucleoside-diphosphate reductase subunit alpha [Patescibacteria group bacterium]
MYWLNDYSRSFLAKGYLAPGMSAEQRIKNIAQTAEQILNKPGFADKFYEYMSKGYYSLASPVWSNFGVNKGLPISCFSSYLGDDMGQILFTQGEVGMMSKYGGGTAGYFGDLRHRGAEIKDNGTSSGAVHFMQLFETLVNVVSQGSVRRGHFAPYLPLEHPDADEFLNIGTEGNPIQEMTYGVTVTDAWLKEMEAGDAQKRALWAKVLQRRSQMGYPYIFFTDTVNNNTVDVYKDKNLKIHASNLCSEILLPSNEEWSFVCDLSSLNLLHYDEWKDTDAVETLVYFLDAVMSDFIGRLEEMRDSSDKRKQEAFHFMSRAYNFAVANRALGLGVLGWHSLLQSKMLPLDSKEAARLNVKIFQDIQNQAYAASKKMAVEYGEPEVLKGYGRRNTTLMAIAPTTSSAFILGQVSQSIEPIWSNCYVKDIDKMKVTIKNKQLEKLLEEKGQNTKEVWNSIRDNDGSVQHLDILSSEEKEIFKTFQEISQKAIIEQAAARQQYIDQGQSLNLAVNPSVPAKEINALYMYAWKLGIKTLYYQHSINAAQQFGRLKDLQNCQSCQS